MSLSGVGRSGKCLCNGVQLLVSPQDGDSRHGQEMVTEEAATAAVAFHLGAWRGRYLIAGTCLP